MKKLIFLCLLSLQAAWTLAQAPFLQSGRVVYERRFNQHSIMDLWQSDDDRGNDENEWKAQMRKNFPRFVTNNYELLFGNGKTVYRLLEDDKEQKYMWNSKPGESDLIVQEPDKHRVSLQREVFEKTYLVQDSMRTLQWRLSPETRTIAGFECRKATTRICDSVVVVAFYCDEIPVSSGPESMGGLPGLILGLAVPRLHTTWFATAVQVQPLESLSLNPKQKGSKSTWASMQTELQKALKDWGKSGHFNMWRFLM